MADFQMLVVAPQTAQGGEQGFAKCTNNGANDFFDSALSQAKSSFEKNEGTPQKTVAKSTEVSHATENDRAKVNETNKSGVSKLPTSTTDISKPTTTDNHSTNDVAKPVFQSDTAKATNNTDEPAPLSIDSEESEFVQTGESHVAQLFNIYMTEQVEHIAMPVVDVESSTEFPAQDSHREQKKPQQLPVTDLANDSAQIAIKKQGGEIELPAEIFSKQETSPEVAVKVPGTELQPDTPPANTASQGAEQAKVSQASQASQVSQNVASESAIDQANVGKTLQVHSEVVAELPADQTENTVPVAPTRTAPIEIEVALPKQNIQPAMDMALVEDESNEAIPAKVIDKESAIDQPDKPNREPIVTETTKPAENIEGKKATKTKEAVEDTDQRPRHIKQPKSDENNIEQSENTKQVRNRKNHNAQEKRHNESENGQNENKASESTRSRRAHGHSSQARPEKAQVGHVPVRTDIGHHQVVPKNSERAQATQSNVTRSNSDQRIEVATAKSQSEFSNSNNSNGSTHSDSSAKQFATPTDSRPASGSVPVSHTATFAGVASSSTTTPVPTQTAPEATQKPYLPPQAPMAQLDGSVKWLLRNDAKMAEIQLYPEHMGKVTVRLRIEGNEVHARIWASEASTIPMLREHRAFLENSLKEQGLNLSSFDLQQGKGGQQAEGNGHDGHNHHKSNHFHFAPQMMEAWNGSEFIQELPIQLTTQGVKDGRVELYA
ncbi:MAG: flagellar hook-length control protein FliK [Holophagaceae bacterium]|nr:flagellar hook-length control protein FliK [Holophagaceae bacterium]